MNDAEDLFGFIEPEANQFRLGRIQTFNWGTFDKLFTFDIPERGYLFVGPSGSGKSTILDAHAALMTPPKWVDFNVAAREAERHGKDRNLITYVRGAWSQQTGESGEYVSQYLRPDTTWSAIAETYRNRDGRVVVLVQVLWIRGKSTAAADVKKLYLIVERELELNELKFFPASDFDVRRFKYDLHDAFIRDKFSAYQERFRHLLGIDSERALRLLHKTQSAKNLGDLNAFLRDFMLDPPETFELADRLVTQFQELDEAHRSVVDARKQIETLRPAREEAGRLEAACAARNALDELREGIDAYKEQQKEVLLRRAIEGLAAEIAGVDAELRQRQELTKAAFDALNASQLRRLELGGNRLEELERGIQEAHTQREARVSKRDVAQRAFTAAGWPYPDDATQFMHRVVEATDLVFQAPLWREAFDEERFSLRDQQKTKEKEFSALRVEIESMERQRSNIPSRLLDIRARLAKALNVHEEKLPFAGELIEVKEEEAEWQGAIERVVGGFARSLLVPDKHYTAVANYLNGTHLGERVVYLRITDYLPTGRSISAHSMIKKLNFAPGAHREWLIEEVKAHFDYECVDTLAAFRQSSRGLTREGQVKHSNTRHEKNDRRPLSDRSQWVLGFDNAAKLKLFKEQAFALAQEVESIKQNIGKRDAEKKAREQMLVHCQTLANLTWNEVDVTSVLIRIQRLEKELDGERQARPDLAQLDKDMEAQKKAHESASSAEAEAVARLREKKSVKDRFVRLQESLNATLLAALVAPEQQSVLDERLARQSVLIDLDNLDASFNKVERGISEERSFLEKQIADHEKQIERYFQIFCTTWPAEAGGLDASVASAPDFFAKLGRLERDGLPEFEERFLQLLHEQSDQNLTRLSAQLDHERKAIRDRMDLVNESLKTAPFNPGTHLVISSEERPLQEVRDFKQSLKASLTQSFSDDPDVSERRFSALNVLVKRFSSQETVDRNWRALVLDVRLHVEFVAREIDASGLEVEVYQSGAGKSGGQRQKLAATCLAAALRYQLGGQDRGLPVFSTVVLDEAFDKADAEFTTMAMNIFKTFGFQMIVATPLKSVMTLEPFIGGACFVHIKDRKYSSVIAIDYDEEARRLKLNTEAKGDQETAAA